MNNDRRKALREAIEALLRAQDELATAADTIQAAESEEQEAFDNMPEGLQQGEKGDKAQAAIDALGEAKSNLETIADELEQCMDNINTAIE